jgi:hypothetical protein
LRRAISLSVNNTFLYINPLLYYLFLPLYITASYHIDRGLSIGIIGHFP